MSSHKSLLVLGVAIVAVFGYIAYSDAVRVKQDVQSNKDQISTLSSESKKLDKQLDKKIEAKSQSEDEVERLEQQKKELEAERQKLEQENGTL